MIDHHEFRLRFRAGHEDEDKVSWFVDCTLTDRSMCGVIQQIVEQQLRDHPQAEFVGMMYHLMYERA